MEYLPRIADKQIQRKLRYSGAVLVEGPKWCGKTTTAAHVAASALYMEDPDKTRAYKELAKNQPSLLLRGAAPRLIDEWQVSTNLWDAIRFTCDERNEPGQFLLTGSTVPPQAGVEHTGTGRIARVKMSPMTLFESKESVGSVSLRDLLSGEAGSIEGENPLTVEKIAYLICRGGWPAALSLDRADALYVARNYIDGVLNSDIWRTEGGRRDPVRAQMLLRSLARHIATTAETKTILADIAAHDTSFTYVTLMRYYRALERIFVVEDIAGWQPSLRSKIAIRSSKKRGLIDPSLAAAALSVSPEGLLADFNLFGFLFESLCTRDIRVYAEANDCDVLYYRDGSGLEADLIVRAPDQSWGAIKVKLGLGQEDEAAKHLLKLAQKVDTEKVDSPKFLMILTGSQFAYRRKDGVYVVPIGCLKP